MYVIYFIPLTCAARVASGQAAVFLVMCKPPINNSYH